MFWCYFFPCPFCYKLSEPFVGFFFCDKFCCFFFVLNRNSAEPEPEFVLVELY
uniref:Uncharacterized protein n=1 Tax=uncultured marine virus TaxID=186617 RepID=A0A0F7L3S3_9VIRU|nr:hypothetical protein [uncultured marine virus]